MNLRSLLGLPPTVVVIDGNSETAAAAATPDAGGKEPLLPAWQPSPASSPRVFSRGNSDSNSNKPSSSSRPPSPSLPSRRQSAGIKIPSSRIRVHHYNPLDGNHQTTNTTTTATTSNTMSTAREIDAGALASAFQSTVSLSASPISTFHSPSSPFSPRALAAASSKQLKPFNTGDVRILLLENVNQTAQDILRAQGYQVESYKASLPEDELIEKIRDVHAVGIRSKTKLSASVLREAKNLIAIGCFCIGTNQVDLDYAAKHGITVFNSPFSNSRSVAELVIAEIIMLARQLGDRSMEMHNGTWNKVSSKCWEIRGKTLGIVGYGHIGSQLSVLAESMGMTVVYTDIVPLMALGMSKQVNALQELLQVSDFVTLHVPELPETKNMIGEEQFAQMKNGSYLINASRGSVVDIPALINAMRSGHVAGAALDVYPSEPAANGDYFNSSLNVWGDELRGLKNLILTPHIGGSTEEAQRAIGVEVADYLVRYINEGNTLGAVNMPEVSLRSLTSAEENHVRVIFIHANRPGVLRQVNSIFGDHNVGKQMSDSRGNVAYLMADISDVNHGDIKGLYENLESLNAKIMTRVLY